MPVRCPSSRSQHSRILRTPTDGLDGSLVLVELHQLPRTLHRVNNKLVVVAARSNVRSVVAPLQPTDLLAVSFVFFNYLWLSAVPDANLSVSGSAGQHRSVGVPVQASDSSGMPVQHLQRFLFGDVEQPNLPHRVADRDVVGVVRRERHRADVVANILGFVELVDLGGAPRPEKHRRLQPDSNIVVRGPIQKIEVEVVLQVRCFEDLVGMLLNLPGFGLLDGGGGLQEAVLLHALVFLVEVHDLLAVQVVLERFAQDLSREQRFVGIDSLRFQQMAGILLLLGPIRHEHVVGVAADLRWDEPIGEVLFVALAHLFGWLAGFIRSRLGTKYAAVDVPVLRLVEGLAQSIFVHHGGGGSFLLQKINIKVKRTPLI